MNTQKISVIGTGYLGATHAACLAELGHEVVGIDTDAKKVAALAAGRVPFHEPGLPELVATHVASGRLRFTTSFAEAAGADVHFLCVGTPQAPDGAADLTYLRAAFAAVAPYAAPHSVIVGKSTVPVGTAAALAETSPVELAWNPEFLREGHAVADTLRPDRLVLGLPATGSVAEAVLRTTYADLLAAGVPLQVTDLATAELTKVAANAFLATKISFINAMAELCEVSGADVIDLADAIGLDERIGRRFLGAGLGFGGGCLPKDIRALQARAHELGRGDAVAFLREVDAVNRRRRDRVVELAAQAVGDFKGVRIAVLGAAFKPGTDDVRDSPALEVARRLNEAGAYVTVYDPAANLTARAVAPALRYAANPVVACRKADLVLHLTEWPEFRDLDPEAVAVCARRRVLIDGRNALDASRWQRAGWTVLAPGRPVAVGAARPAEVVVP